ncbi:M12 family metallo-peptidase [Dyadobacter sp. Leaf189]|uniref:M12 family metallo-peptidase n=1 Tax=Dyadobacter sp. Leaf189 TaxID=1736295 RepID=UPI00070143D0|nr:M12 family metallo-peptidase [Dyadobacter sp. Leaf189]KQS27706.1 hypothetical protein ASG33_14835 [Dyadobacter sp. Leaf189]
MKPHFTSKLLLLTLFIFIFKPAYSQKLPPACGTSDSVTGAVLAKYAMLKDLTRARTSAGEKLEYRLALDVNYETYLIYNGDKERITREAYRFIQAASDIFEREINVKLTVSFIHIWDKREPYVLNEDFDYFNNVLNYWTTNRFEERDAVVSLSCRSGWFYGGYRMCSSNFPTPGNNTNIDVDLLAHELGHTLGSPHTHSCSWPGGPIDRCTLVEGAPYECPDGGYTEYVNGSIMSYCRSVLTFHPLCRNLMRDYAEGKVIPDFKLGAFSEKPDNATILTLNEPDQNAVTSTPAFKWEAAKRADQYRFQSARDQSFTQIIEDVVTKQAYVQSNGLAEGVYYARYRPENELGNGNWSESVPFSVLPFSENTLPPLLSDIKLSSNGSLSGYFQWFAGISSYEVQVRDLGEKPIETQVLTPTSNGRQFFIYPQKLDWFRNYAIRIRVKKNDIWSKWSQETFTSPVWYNELMQQYPQSRISASPILANIFDKRALYPEYVKSDLQVATDADFKNIIANDSVNSNGLNSWYTTKTIHRPVLDENKYYFVRSRLRWNTSSMTDWTTGQLTTGFRDQRFEFLGLVSPNLQSLNSARSGIPMIKFFKTADKLYVHEWYSGYYETGDLKEWKANTPSTSSGYIPTTIAYFGASQNGNVFLIDGQNKLIEQSRPTYEYARSPQKFYHSQNGTLLVSQKDGIFMRSDNAGVVRFFNGEWFYYDHTTLMTDRALVVAADPDGQIWALMDGGNVWRFNNGWSQHSYIRDAQLVSGISFDNDKNAYAYGEFGVLKFNSGSGGWDPVEQLASIPVKKIVFDKENRMWAAAYKQYGADMIYHALIKYKEGQINVYADGLNILREPFDVEVFKDKVILLTSGGELHSFEESAIQRFTPRPAYCTEDELTSTITSNSFFSKDNRTLIRFKKEDSASILSVPAGVESNLVRFKIPDSLAAGSYTLQTVTTNPAIESNESAPFMVYKPAPALITLAKNSASKALLKANEGEALTYQWQFNGKDIPGATGSTFSAVAAGNYQVVVSNAGGCRSRSAELTVALETPSGITLLQNTPNPVISSTDISFYLPESQEIELDVLNVRGQVVRHVEKGNKQSGWHLATLDAAHLPSGVYIYRLKAGTVTRTVKMVR